MTEPQDSALNCDEAWLAADTRTQRGAPVPGGPPLRESQTYQSIGKLAPAAEQALTNQKVWDGLATKPPMPVQPIDQLQAQDFSFWNKRANRQALATTGESNYAADFFSPVNHPADLPPTAGYSMGDASYHQTPTAATDPAPFKAAPGGPVPGADTALETSGNSGLQN